jgi:hypothetical protein
LSALAITGWSGGLLMVTSRKSKRGLIAIGLAIGLVVAACGSSSAPGIPGVPGVPGSTNANGGGGGTLASGLSANLDALDSYQFSWQYSISDATATAAASGALGTSGTVVNKPTKAYKVNAFGIEVLVIGAQGWTSSDNGTSWMTSTDYASGSSSLDAFLPTSMYGTNFDANGTNFSVKGDETKNGIDCVHYVGNSSLGALSALGGVGSSFHADLWVAKSGNYPVSGFYGWSVTSNGQSGTWGYKFDITHVNDAAANVITPPTNVIAIPT